MKIIWGFLKKKDEHEQQLKSRLLAANVSDLEEDSDDSQSALSTVKSFQDFEERWANWNSFL